jgi:hypothetical protein
MAGIVPASLSLLAPLGRLERLLAAVLPQKGVFRGFDGLLTWVLIFAFLSRQLVIFLDF